MHQERLSNVLSVAPIRLHLPTLRLSKQLQGSHLFWKRKENMHVSVFVRHSCINIIICDVKVLQKKRQLLLKSIINTIHLFFSPFVWNSFWILTSGCWRQRGSESVYTHELSSHCSLLRWIVHRLNKCIFKSTCACWRWGFKAFEEKKGKKGKHCVCLVTAIQILILEIHLGDAVKSL